MQPSQLMQLVSQPLSHSLSHCKAAPMRTRPFRPGYMRVFADPYGGLWAGGLISQNEGVIVLASGERIHVSAEYLKERWATCLPTNLGCQ